MLKDTDLHVYLDDKPAPDIFNHLMQLYGFKHARTIEARNNEPTTDVYEWSLPKLSGEGFKLLYFWDLFPDDLNQGKYNSFIILSGYQGSSQVDLNMIDIVALLLISRYGGRLHNPQRLEKISTGFLLSGQPFSGF